MKKLAFFGAIILGLFALLTHLGVTVIVGFVYLCSTDLARLTLWLQMIHKLERPEVSVPIPELSGPVPWLATYGVIGSLLIICATAFLAIALLKRLKTTKQPDD